MWLLLSRCNGGFTRLLLLLCCWCGVGWHILADIFFFFQVFLLHSWLSCLGPWEIKWGLSLSRRYWLRLNVIFSSIEVIWVIWGLLVGPRWRTPHFHVLKSWLKIFLRRDSPLSPLNRWRHITLGPLYRCANARRRPLDTTRLWLSLLINLLLILLFEIILVLLRISRLSYGWFAFSRRVPSSTC